MHDNLATAPCPHPSSTARFARRLAWVATFASLSAAGAGCEQVPAGDELELTAGAILGGRVATTADLHATVAITEADAEASFCTGRCYDVSGGR